MSTCLRRDAVSRCWLRDEVDGFRCPREYILAGGDTLGCAMTTGFVRIPAIHPFPLHFPRIPQISASFRTAQVNCSRLALDARGKTISGQALAVDADLQGLV